MSNIWNLTRVLIRNNVFAFSGRKKKGKQVSTKGSAIGYVCFLIFCVACIGGPIIYTLSGLLKEYNLSELILSFVLPLGGIISIIFGVFSIISVFYFNKDSEQLLPLPIKSSELLISKFLASLISEYLMLMMFVFPLIFGVGVGVGASFLYYIYSIIICLLMPVIPSVIMAIILMLCNKVFNFGKRKDIFMYIMTGVILVFAFAYSFGLQYFIDGEDSQSLLVILSGDYSGYLKISRFLFPFFNSATYSLVHYEEFLGFASIMTFIGLNLLFMVILYFVGDKLYVKGLTNDNGRGKNKKESVDKIYKSKKGGVMKELIRKEWLTIKRSPVFMLNVIIVNLIFPLILGISFIFGFSSDSTDTLSSLIGLIDFSNAGVLLITIGILMFLCSMSTATSSAISREGNSAWMMKTIPISLKKQMDAKVYFSMIIDLIILAMLEIILMVLFKTPWYYLIVVDIPLILTMLIVNYVSLLLDLRKPRLDWKEENEAVKQNLNVFIAMMLVVLIAAIFAIVGVLIIKYNVNIYLMFSLVSVILLAIYIMIVALISKNQNRLFNKVG